MHLRQLTAVLMIVSFAPTMRAARKPVEQQATEIAIGNRVEVQIKGKGRYAKGVLLAVKPDGITIQAATLGRSSVETIQFGEIQHIRDAGSNALTTRIFAGIGTALALVAGLLLILIVVAD
jgi:hypothetical protein